MPEINPKPVNPFKKTSTSVKRSLIISSLAIVFSVIALIVAWFAWAAIHHDFKSVGHYISKSRDETQKAKQTFESQLTILQNKMNEADMKLKQLSSLSLQSHNQRAFSEASYLIHLANLQLVINQNTENAMHMLQIAQNQLKQISNPTVSALKLAVAKDLASLQKAPQIDVANLIGRIQSLKESVAKLPSLPNKKITASQTPKTDDPANASLPWYKKLGHGLSGFKDLVIIRHNQQPVKPLLTPEQLIFLKENVQLKLSETEWAILHQNVDVYKQSLSTAKQMLNEYYPNPDNMSEIIDELNELLKLDIKPDLPTLSHTMNVLHHTILTPTDVDKKPRAHE